MFRRSPGESRSVRGQLLIALGADELVAEHRAATSERVYPRAADQRRIVADVLVVSAVELGDPVPGVILLIARDRSLQRCCPLVVAWTLGARTAEKA